MFPPLPHAFQQVVLPSLLEQTQRIMRRLFSTVIIKRTYTLTFDRSEAVATEPHLAEKLYEKMNRARLERAVVVATPEVVKSLQLKYIDILHNISLLPDVYKRPASEEGGNVRSDVRLAHLRHTHAMEQVADSLGKIIQLWGKQYDGVLLLDEVDLLLHPLKSELNFPIGEWHQLEQSPERWLLPMHLIDALFYAQCGRLAMEGVQRTAKVDALLLQINEAIEDGARDQHLQLRPHLIVLDRDYYHDHMKPLLASWLLLYLEPLSILKPLTGDATAEESKTEAGPGTGDAGEHCDNLPPEARSAMLGFLLGATADEASSQWVATRCEGSPAMKLMNLARDWLNTFLPHVLGKVNRVSYGVLNDEDQHNFGSLFANMPKTRKQLAVPFIAKDVPSRASEFAHPEVLLGLTILGYRYDGLRSADMTKVRALSG